MSTIVKDYDGPKYFDDEEEDEQKGESDKNTCIKEKPLLFIYPDHVNPLTIFDYDELVEENLCILSKKQEDLVKIHIWRGQEFIESSEVHPFLFSLNFTPFPSYKNEQVFLDEIIQNNFPHQDVNKIFVYHEVIATYTISPYNVHDTLLLLLFLQGSKLRKWRIQRLLSIKLTFIIQSSSFLSSRNI